MLNVTCKGWVETNLPNIHIFCTDVHWRSTIRRQKTDVRMENTDVREVDFLPPTFKPLTLSVVMLSVVMLNVVMLSVVILSDVAPP